MLKEKYQIYFGDCLEVMDQLTSNSIDLILADLPYGTTACDWDIIIPFELLWEKYKKVSKKNTAVILFGNQPFSSLIITSNVKNFKHHWIWNKIKPAGFQHAKYKPLMQHEDIFVFCSGKLNYRPIKTKRIKTVRSHIYSTSKSAPSSKKDNNDRTYKDYYPKSILEFSNADQNNRLHPTQKPVPLLEYLILTYTNEGDLVLDNTMGSGSTGEACLRTNRKFIGIEKDPEYFEIAKKRLEIVDLTGSKYVKTEEEIPVNVQIW